MKDFRVWKNTVEEITWVPAMLQWPSSPSISVRRCETALHLMARTQLLDYATRVHLSQLHRVFMRVFWAGKLTRDQLDPTTSYSVAVRPPFRSETGTKLLKTYSKVLGINGATQEEERKIHDDVPAMLKSKGMKPDILS